MSGKVIPPRPIPPAPIKTMNNSIYKCEYCGTEDHILHNCRGCGAALKSNSDKKVVSVDVGNIPASDAEAYIRLMMKQYWSNRDNPEINNNPTYYIG